MKRTLLSHTIIYQNEAILLASLSSAIEIQQYDVQVPCEKSEQQRRDSTLRS